MSLSAGRRYASLCLGVKERPAWVALFVHVSTSLLVFFTVFT